MALIRGKVRFDGADDNISYLSILNYFGSMFTKLNSKQTVESCLCLSIYWLKNIECLSGNKQVKLNWQINNQHSVQIILNFVSADLFICFKHSILNDTGEASDFEYQTIMETTSCHFNGKRFWFVCGNCSRRVAKLYLPTSKKRFSCRNCHNLTYNLRKESNKKFTSFLRSTKYKRKREKMECRIKKKVYRGKLTKIYSRYHAALHKEHHLLSIYANYINGLLMK